MDEVRMRARMRLRMTRHSGSEMMAIEEDKKEVFFLNAE